MQFVSITGPKADIDRVVDQYLSRYEIHLENALAQLQTLKTLTPYLQINPYKGLLAKALEYEKLLDSGNIQTNLTMTLDEAVALIESFDQQLTRINEQKKELEDQKKELEELLLRQGIHIEYIDTLETLDEKVRQPDALRNQRRRWIATQLFLALKMGRNLPTALLNGNGDYLLKTLQAFIAPRSILLALIGFFSCVLCIFSPTSSIKWWILLILLNGALYLAIPSNMRYKYMSRILRQTPYFVIIMLLNLFHLKGMAQKFNHTQHG